MKSITLLEGDIFETEMQTIIIPVNCVGVMGKGLALEAKKRFSDLEHLYKDLCDESSGRKLYIGDIIGYGSVDWNKNIMFFPTKKHWRERSKLEYIDQGLSELVKQEKGDIESWEIDRYDHNFNSGGIAFPALGCGAGGLDWNDVKPLMIRYLSQLDIPIEIYLPIEQ